MRRIFFIRVIGKGFLERPASPEKCTGGIKARMQEKGRETGGRRPEK